nr:ribosome maturation protein SBDS [Tanacetum cinerariifolium]
MISNQCLHGWIQFPTLASLDVDAGNEPPANRNQTKICLEILEKGELQVAGKERESQLSNQLKDIAAIVMQKTINPETQSMYTIIMIERLMHEIHFAMDAHGNSKKHVIPHESRIDKYNQMILNLQSLFTDSDAKRRWIGSEDIAVVTNGDRMLG